MQSSRQPRTGFGFTIIKIALVMFAVEIMIMFGLQWLDLQLPDWKVALIDASLLALIVATIAYFAIIYPKDLQIQTMMEALVEARRDAEHLARYDELTGVLSRRALIEAVSTEVERAKRYGTALSCLMLDLDHFKTINDTYGHQLGDQVLHQISQVISDECRTNDRLGRYGGEEFLIILPATSIEAATVLAERVRLAVAETALDQIDERVTVSIGVADWRDGEDSAFRLIEQADQALLKSKATGRNRIVASKPV